METNNSDFWAVAYREHAPALLGVLRRYVRDVGVAEDLLHDVFIAAIDKHADYTGRGAFAGWLYRIAVNTALLYLRQKRTVETSCAATLHVADDDGHADEGDDPRAAIEAAGFSSEELLAAIDRLPEHHRLVFNMYVMDDFSHKQIGAALNISSGTSKSHLARARKKIQQLLYEEAMNRRKKRDRRRASAFLLFFPAKTHYIDRLYRKGLSDLSIPPAGAMDFLPAALEQHVASVASSAAAGAPAAAFWGSKLSYMVACCGTAAITGSVCWVSMSEHSPLKHHGGERATVFVADTLHRTPVLPFVEADDDDVWAHEEQIPPADDNSASSVRERPAPPKIEAAAEEKKAPVVVKKQIVEYQTVVVRDTIYIIE